VKSAVHPRIVPICFTLQRYEIILNYASKSAIIFTRLAIFLGGTSLWLYIAILHIALRNLVCEVERRVIYSIN